MYQPGSTAVTGLFTVILERVYGWQAGLSESLNRQVVVILRLVLHPLTFQANRSLRFDIVGLTLLCVCDLWPGLRAGNPHFGLVCPRQGDVSLTP